MHDLQELLLDKLSLNLFLSLPYPDVEILNLIKEESLEQFHLSFYVPKFTLVYLVEDPTTGIFNSGHALLFHVYDFSSNDSFKLFKALFVHDFSLELELGASILKEI
jgi:hypothetical protein